MPKSTQRELAKGTGTSCCWRHRHGLVWWFTTACITLCMVAAFGFDLAISLNSAAFYPGLSRTLRNDIIQISTIVPAELNRSNIWVQLTFSIDFDQDIMHHSIHHYIHTLHCSPDSILVALHSQDANKTSQMAESMQQLQNDFGIQHFHTWSGNYSSNRLWETRGRHRQLVGITSDSNTWIVRSDADEFPAIPGNHLPNFLHFVEEQGYDAVFGKFFDRVAPHGILANISSLALAPLHEQFPWSCPVTETISHGYPLKVVAFRATHRENRGGHGLLTKEHSRYLDEGDNDVSAPFRTETGLDHCGYPPILRIDHFKWTFPVLEKLQRRYQHYKDTNMHFRESKRILDHIERNNGHLNTKELKCQHIPKMGPILHQALYQEGMACGILP